MKNFSVNNLRIIILFSFIMIYTNVQCSRDTINNNSSFSRGQKIIANPDETPEYSVPPCFHFLRFGEVQPTGWIKEQMIRDLKDGFAGKLDKIAKEAATDIFASGRNRPDKANTENSAGDLWWNGETEGNWRTGFIMLAYLSGDSDAIKKADLFVSHILAAQDKNGYLGIFSDTLQYRKAGDLWTQACLLRGLLAYSELSGNLKVLKAVERSVKLTINTFGPGKRPVPLWQTHDLMYTDVLEDLYNTTGDTIYRNFALWLYEDYYCKNAKAGSYGSDLILSKITKPDVMFTSHGVHAYEHLRVPLFLWMATGRDDIGRGWQNAMNAVEKYSYPGGAAVSQESVDNLAPDPTYTMYEYCVIKELNSSMESALQKTGDGRYGDRIEQIWFNAAQGARIPNGGALTYLTSDNRYTCDQMTPDGKKSQPRNKFSPAHADVAVCCNPFATQIAPYYVRSMWMRPVSGEGLSAMLYGPCLVTTDINNIQVTIEEKTNYPFENTLEFVVSPAKANAFPLNFRNPSWSQNTVVVCKGAKIVREGDYWKVEKKWKQGDVVKIIFSPLVKEIRAVNNEVALQYGALLFALPLPSEKKVIKSYPDSGFEDFELLPSEKVEPLSFDKQNGLEGFGFKAKQVAEGGNLLRPFDKPVIKLTGNMIDSDGTQKEVDLVPLGNAYGLRQVTFPVIQK